METFAGCISWLYITELCAQTMTLSKPGKSENARRMNWPSCSVRKRLEQAGQLDIADLNLSDEIAASIADGIRTLKQLRDKPAAQVNFINSLQPGARLLLCLWIMDMDLLKKIQRRSYLRESPASQGSE